MVRFFAFVNLDHTLQSTPRSPASGLALSMSMPNRFFFWLDLKLALPTAFPEELESYTSAEAAFPPC
jgi:hypothetical protein